MWGIGTLLDALIRVVMAYTLPVDVVPALGAYLWPVTFIGLQVPTNMYFQSLKEDRYAVASIAMRVKCATEGEVM
jgi:hypothetical protein